jgi:hypothetical protein
MAAGQYDDGGAPRPVEEVLTDVEQLLGELAGSVSSDDVAISRLVEVSARLRVAGVRIDALRWSVLPRIEAEGSWALTGARTFAVWLARTQDVRTVTAKHEVRTARALRDHLPATLTAALAGKVGVDKVRALVEVATTSTQRTRALGSPAVDLATFEPATIEPAPEDLTGPTADEPATDGPASGEPASGEPAADSPDAGADDGPATAGPAGAVGGVGSLTWEEQLLDWSAENGPDQFRGLVRYFARHADPDADERGYTKTKDREHLDVSPTLGGYHLSGFLTEEHGQTLTTALGSLMGAPTPGDDRTPGQCRAQALADMTRVVLDNGHTGTGASVRPHLTVTVSWTELQALATKNRIKNDGLNTGATTRAGTTELTGTTNVTGHSATVGAPSVKRPAVFTETNSPVPTTLNRPGFVGEFSC